MTSSSTRPGPVRKIRTAAVFLSATLLLAACGSETGTASTNPSSQPAAAAAGSLCGADGKINMPTAVPEAGPQTAPAQGKAATPTHKDLAYATTSPAQKLDLYLPPGATGKTPLLIDIHGGGFLLGDKAQEGQLLAPDQLAQGYAVASINYRLGCEARFPAGVQDVKAAIRWLRAHAATYNLDPDKFVAWGQSAGAYLSAMAAVTGDQKTVFDDDSLGNAGVSSAVQGAVAWYGPYDFGTQDKQFEKNRPAACKTEILKHGPSDAPESTWLGGALDTVPDKVKQANPATYLPTARSIAPISLAAGDSDCLIPHQQSQDLHDAIKAAGGQVTISIVPGAGHSTAVDKAEMHSALKFADGLFKR
ncbi:alpha/beta fold hydrolase [Amycolatopsis sp. NPDC059090]|uniref:alpha/beta fold hydrolase n=1 Tax=unclassified Amycolatopsis TaxID=2618356 RepID=UPI00366E3339